MIEVAIHYFSINHPSGLTFSSVMWQKETEVTVSQLKRVQFTYVLYLKYIHTAA